MCDKLEDTQRKLGAITYGSHGSEISYLKLQAVLASHDLIYRLSQLQEHLSKREALVTEQEQASAENEIATRIAEEVSEERYEDSLNTSPQFAVGDTVMIKESWPWSKSEYLGNRVGVECTIVKPKMLDYPGHENYDNKPGWELSTGCDVAPCDLTKIAKGQA